MTAENHAYEEIAPRLRELRNAVEMSVDELAVKTGVTPDEVSLYESGKEEIPVSYLMNVARVCGVGLTVLISGMEAHLTNYTVVRNGEGLSVDRRKDYDYKNLAPAFVGRRMEPFLIDVPPKDSSALNFTSHQGQEFIYVLDGSLELRLDENIIILNEGDSLYFDSKTPHALRGLNGVTARMLDVIL
ncbi:helix-turn-helix domain-containing protein [Maridesulfovibrio bastinii]|uniref:helix-turn-helix domain-containing protein n=1 Tax=Maridesulfovibrio bastinii TaxID=47157 RepID=UPI0004027A78|nr:XRE family transcriptional regulator [Maridesulfovibrio bastinii]